MGWESDLFGEIVPTSQPWPVWTEFSPTGTPVRHPAIIWGPLEHPTKVQAMVQAGPVLCNQPTSAHRAPMRGFFTLDPTAGGDTSFPF